MNDTILQALLVTAIEVLLPVLLGFLVVVAKNAIEQIKAKVDKEKLDFVLSLVRQFVLAAEQNGLTGALKDEGVAKKAWVLEQLKTELAKKNIHIDLDMLSGLIEAAVHEAFKMI